MKYRLNLNLSELERLQEIFEDIKESDKYDNYYFDLESFKSLDEMIKNPKEIKCSGSKILAAERATEARTKKAKANIGNAIDILRLECKKITHYSIAKVSKVSYNTVKKYLTDATIKSLNNNAKENE